MRPLHALLVVVVLFGLAGTAAWFVLAEDRPGSDRPAAPIADDDVAVEAADADVARPAEDAAGSGARAALEAPPVEPAATGAASRSGGGPVLVGRVVDAAGAPVSGATVLGAASHHWTQRPIDETGGLFGPRPKEGATDADGRFEIRGLAAGPIRVAVRAGGFAPWDGPETAIPTGVERHDLGAIALEPGVVLEGRVLDGAGRPVADATLERFTTSAGFAVLGSWAGGVELARTGPDGGFHIDQMAAGPWSLFVRSEAHPSELATGSTSAPGEVQRDLVIELAPGEEITGRVVGLPAGGVSDLVVRAAPVVDGVRRISRDGFDPRYEMRSARVARDGSFRLRGLWIDRAYRLTALEGSGRVPGGPFGRSVSPTTEARAGQRNVELVWQPEAALVFQVVDARTGEPVTAMDVRAGTRFALPVSDEAGLPRTEFEDGIVRAGDLRPRENERAQVSIDAVGYEPWKRDDIAVRLGQEVDLGTIALVPAPVLTVLVLDERSEAPIPGARVRLSERNPQRGADAGPGSFSIEIDAQHGPGGMLLGAGTTAVTDEDGEARLSSRQGRLCRIEVTADDLAPATVDLELPVGEPHTEVVRLGPGGTVELTVVDVDGQPVAGEKIRHRRPSQADLPDFMLHGAAVTDDEGRLVLEHLEAGLHSFALGADEGPMVFMDEEDEGGGQRRVGMRFSRAGFGDAPAPENPWHDVDVAEDARHELQIVAPLKLALSGRVLEDGLPLAGATVRLEDPDESGGPRLPGLFGESGPSARTDGKGYYEIPNVETGDYEMVIEHESRHMPARRELTLARGSERFDVDLPVSIVEGTVSGPEGPLEGIRVRVEEGGGGARPQMLFVTAIDDGSGASFSAGGLGDAAGRVTTDTRGRFSIRGVRPGVTLVVAAEGPGYTPAKSEPFTVEPGQIRTGTDVALYAGGSLEVRVFDAGGEPAGQVLLRLTYDGEEYDGVEPKTSITNAEGVARVDGLVPGPWKIRANRLGTGSIDLGSAPEFEGRVVEKEQTPVSIELPD